MSREILQDIIDNFAPEKFSRFFREKHRSFSPRQESFPQYNDECFTDGLKIGEIKFPEGEDLLVCAFKAGQPLSERSGKKAQYEKGKKILKEAQSDAGIFIFYDEQDAFRFSLIYPETIGNRRQWSNFRRFTYFVSREFTNKTFLSRVGNFDFSSLGGIKDAFSVEKVTDKFFEEFRAIFEKTKREFQKTNKHTVCAWLKDRYPDKEVDEQINKFTYTFLGRIVFLYFLLRKGWIEGRKDFIRKMVSDKHGAALYSNFFQPLFFDVFAKKESERPDHIKSIYRDTPYLNGGLFEKSDLENAMEKAGKFILFGDAFIRGTIEFFEGYSFTIDENSPDDQEVSIDPEMLGKVFENTLAEEERGKKGTFYTPREIVHFMVKEALWQFLKNETMLDSEKLHGFIYEPEFDLDQFSKPELRLIDRKLETVKVLDPAVGSAAFPVEMMQVLVHLRKRLDVKVGKNLSEVNLKKQFIKNNLYGVDIDPGAVEIAKLRIWLALIVDYEKSEIEPLPNLDFQFRIGNSLQEKIDEIDIFRENALDHQDFFEGESGYRQTKQKMIFIKDKFYESSSDLEKKKLKKEFDGLEHQLIQAVLEKYDEDFRSQLKNRDFKNTPKLLKETTARTERLERKIKDGTYKLFKPDFHFSEVFDRRDENGKKQGGFDIVIGNPPYGVRVDDEIKEWHGLGSKDSYGVFISTSLKRFLKTGGVLSFIVSDTWLTIKTHRELREQALENRLHKIIRVHQDCFDATVNACILSLTHAPDNDGGLIAADLTNISTRKEIIDLREKLYHLEKFIGESTPVCAVYRYSQGLIKTNSNYPIFVGSPKLFKLMNDTTCKTVEREISEKEKKKVRVRQIELNGKMIELVRFGDIAEIRVGLQTGDNDYYLFQNPEARGSYRSIEQYRKFLLTEKDLEKIAKNDALRLKVIEKGLHKASTEKSFDEDLWFGGHYIVPYDKGGESDTDTGWLPNYYVPTNYFIDWSSGAAHHLINEKLIRRQSTKPYPRNTEFYFKSGISFSDSGQYSPTYRLNFNSVFDQKGSCIFTPLNELELLGMIASKLSKYCMRNFINHSVSGHVDCQKEIPLIISPPGKLRLLVDSIIKKQKKEPYYDYMNYEQKEIDRLVYEMYGLDADDIREVETWYARRYPKLARFCETEESSIADRPAPADVVKSRLEKARSA